MTNRTAYALMAAFGAVIIASVVTVGLSKYFGRVEREADEREAARVSGQHVRAVVAPDAATAIDARIAADAHELTAEEIAAQVAARNLDAEHEEKEAAKREAIADFSRRFSDQRHANAAVKVGDRTLVFHADVDHCNARLLLELRAALVAAKLAPGDVLDRINCGDMGDEIDTHTKNGCVAGATDQLIITDAGARRDKLATGIGEAVGGGDFIVNAMGCDATVLAIALLSSGNGSCDLARLQALKAEGGDKFVGWGFTSLKCDPDGPELPLR